MSETLNKATIQFPLCLLAYSDQKSRVFSCLAWGIATAGLNRLQTLTKEQQDTMLAPYDEPKGKKVLTNDAFRAVSLGRIFSNVLFTNAEWVWREYERAELFVSEWRNKGRKSPLARVPSQIVGEVAWHGGKYSKFAALAAFNTVIGRKPFCIVTRNRIRAGMLGYAGGRMLFDQDDNLTTSGRKLLAERTDGITAEDVITTSQARTILANLERDGLANSYTPPRRDKFGNLTRRGCLTYYSKFLPPELIADAILTRLEKRKGPNLAGIDARILAIKDSTTAAPLCSEAVVKSLHNGESLHNGQTATKSLPAHQSVATESLPDRHIMLPCNASSQCFPVMLPENASTNAGVGAFSQIKEALIPKMEYKPPTQDEVIEFAKGLFKADGMEDIASEWFNAHGDDPEWTRQDWKRSFARFAGRMVEQMRKRAKAE